MTWFCTPNWLFVSPYTLVYIFLYGHWNVHGIPWNNQTLTNIWVVISWMQPKWSNHSKLDQHPNFASPLSFTNNSPAKKLSYKEGKFCPESCLNVIVCKRYLSAPQELYWRKPSAFSFRPPFQPPPPIDPMLCVKRLRTSLSTQFPELHPQNGSLPVSLPADGMLNSR